MQQKIKVPAKKLICTTDRLVIREFIAADYAFIIELLNSDGWLQFIGNRNISDKQQAVTYITDALQNSYAKNGFGLYNVLQKETNTSLGMCGFVKRDTLPCPDLGFAFLPQYAGNGFAYESANVLVNYGFEKLGFKKLAAITKPANNNSVKLLTKLEFIHEENIVLNEETLMLFEKNNILHNSR